MDNSAENKPLGGHNYWAMVESRMAEVEASEKLRVAEKRRDLTLAVFTRTATRQEKIDWDLCMPIPYSLCKEVIDDAAVLDKKRLKVKHFSSYELNDSEAELFDILADFGQALGVEAVMRQVKSQALVDQCTKSQKMYMDYIAGIDFDGGGDDGVSLHIHLTDEDEDGNVVPMTKKKEKELIDGEIIDVELEE